MSFATPVGGRPQTSLGIISLRSAHPQRKTLVINKPHGGIWGERALPERALCLQGHQKPWGHSVCVELSVSAHLSFLPHLRIRGFREKHLQAFCVPVVPSLAAPIYCPIDTSPLQYYTLHPPGLCLSVWGLLQALCESWEVAGCGWGPHSYPRVPGLHQASYLQQTPPPCINRALVLHAILPGWPTLERCSDRGYTSHPFSVATHSGVSMSPDGRPLAPDH